MKKSILKNSTYFYLCGAALTAVMLSGVPALAQGTSGTAPDTADQATVKNGDSTVIIVTGSRTSQRSSIDRKKNAKTATDSIVAEDIGSFPDKNIAEAISRIAGIQLNRDSFGEGNDVQVRGEGPDTTRVEIDGMGQLSTRGNLGAGGDTVRGGDFRELPSDLVKSVDVVKGSLPSNTEGSLGGSIKINTRTGLDFKKPYFSFRYDQTENTIGKKWTPEWNLIASHKFFGNRLGVLTNITYSEIQNNTDQEQPATSGTAGYFRNVDLDQSPNKTFSYENSPVDPSQTAGNFRILSPTTGAVLYSSLSPVDIVKKSGAAKTKADCLAAFPALTVAQLTAIPAGNNVLGTVATANVSQTNNRNAAQNEQANALATCLNQWNDYTPSLIRVVTQESNERRLAADLRFDYKVNNDLTVYLKTSIADVTRRNDQFTINYGNAAFNTAGTFQWNVNGTLMNSLPSSMTSGTGIVVQALIPRVPNAGYVAYDNGVGGSVIADIANPVVDASHHATSFTLTDGSFGTTTTNTRTVNRSWYAQAGGTYNHGPVKLDFMMSTSGATAQSEGTGIGFSFNVGQEKLHVTPTGLWSYDLPAGLDLYNANNYYPVNAPTAALAASAASAYRAAAPAYSVTQQASFGDTLSLTYRPSMGDDRETQVKYDLTYNFTDKMPFFTDVQIGMQARNHVGNGWGGGGYEFKSGTGVIGAAGYVAPVVLQSNNSTIVVRDCLPPTTVQTGNQSCNYGYADGAISVNGDPIFSLNGGASSGAVNPRGGVMTMTPTDLRSMIASALYERKTDFLGDLPNKGNITLRYPYIDVDKVLEKVPHPAFTLDCEKSCLANDGNVYEQPHSAYRENTQAFYYMVEFEQHLPFDMTFNGNFGTRYVKTITNATGFMTFSHVAKTATFDPAHPDAAGGTLTTTVKLNTVLDNVTEDWTPSYNLNLWVIPGKVVARYYSGHVIARPSVRQLLPSGSCTISDVTLSVDDGTGELDQFCTGRVGNPGLQPYKAINHNESVEWYVNKDTMFSLSYYYNNIYIGAPRNSQADAANSKLFAGTGFVDPVTGVPLSDTQFSYPTYENGPGGIKRGVEFSTKLAFSYLPWLLKYTGTDFNYSQLAAKNTEVARDLITGQFLPPQNQASYFENWSIWYDDGRFNARIAYQGRGESLKLISSKGSNVIKKFPTAFAQSSGQTIRTPYNPGGTVYASKQQFVDLKLNYKINQSVELFFDGRNVLHRYNTLSFQPYLGFSDGTPAVLNYAYGGSRMTVGFTVRH